MAERRLFGGAYYELFPYFASKLTKKEAQKEAKRYRRKGWLVRVAPTGKVAGKTVYGTWVRK